MKRNRQKTSIFCLFYLDVIVVSNIQAFKFQDAAISRVLKTTWGL